MNTITWTLGSSDDSPRAFFGLSELEWNSVVGAVATAACVGSHSTTAVLVDTTGNERRVRAVRQHGASWRLEETTKEA